MFALCFAFFFLSSTPFSPHSPSIHTYPPQRPPADLVVPPAAVSVDESAAGLLGKGGFASVRRGQFGGLDVAVKELSVVGRVPDRVLQGIVAEARVLHSVHHGGCVGFKGLLWDTATGRYALVLEYVGGWVGVMSCHVSTNVSL